MQRSATSNVIQDVTRIFEWAQLEVLSPTFYGMGKELGIAAIATRVMGDNSDHLKEFMNTRGIQGLIRAAAFALSSIDQDPEFARLLHDRICEVNKLPSAFVEYDTLRRTSNFVQDIHEASEAVQNLAKTLYPEIESETQSPSSFRVLREELAALKTKLKPATLVA